MQLKSFMHFRLMFHTWLTNRINIHILTHCFIHKYQTVNGAIKLSSFEKDALNISCDFGMTFLWLMSVLFVNKVFLNSTEHKTNLILYLWINPIEA